MTTWVNGERSDVIETSDRSLNYGDGIFTTLLVTQGQCQDLTAHLMRLQQGIKALSIAQINYPKLATHLVLIAKDTTRGVIKVIVSRGIGLRGYSSVGCDSPNIIVTLNDYPAHYQSLQQTGINLGVSTVALGLNPLLAGLKHLNRLEQVLVRQQIDSEQWQDALVLDCQGFVVETSMANIFWVKDHVIYTPSLELAGVKGIMRDKVMTWLQQAGYEVNSGRYRLGSVISADEVFMTNCLMTIVAVNQIEDACYTQRTIFDLVTTKYLSELEA